MKTILIEKIPHEVLKECFSLSISDLSVADPEVYSINSPQIIFSETAVEINCGCHCLYDDNKHKYSSFNLKISVDGKIGLGYTAVFLKEETVKRFWGFILKKSWCSVSENIPPAHILEIVEKISEYAKKT